MQGGEVGVRARVIADVPAISVELAQLSEGHLAGCVDGG